MTVSGSNTARIQELGDRLVALVRSDPAAAAATLNDMDELARRDGHAASRALCIRARGNLHQIEGRLSQALDEYRAALDTFHECGDLIEAARTASSLVGALAPAGEYAEALRHAEFARNIFEKNNLTQRLARLDVNVGNIFHRLGKLDEAHRYYERAAEVLAETEDVEAAAGVMINSAVITMLLYRFDRALEAFHKATAYCRDKKLHLLQTQSEYNRAYLLYLTGRALDALKALQAVEHEFEGQGDRFHIAQCRMDRAEILAELSSYEDSLQLSIEAESMFEDLGAVADRARALLLVSRCRMKLRDFSNACKALTEAKALFEREGNTVWSNLADLENSAVLMAQSRYTDARQVASRAGEALKREGDHVYGIQAELMTAQASIAEGRFDVASRILMGIDAGNLPLWLFYHHCYLKGLVKENCGDIPSAIDLFCKAVEAIEFLGRHIGIDDFLLRFSAGKRDAYLHLVSLLDDPAMALQYAERSRMFDITNASDRCVPAVRESEPSRQLRQALRADYVELFHKPAKAAAPLLHRIQEREREFLRAVRTESIERFSASRSYSAIPAPSIAEDEVLIEFFVEERQVCAFIVTIEGVSRFRLPCKQAQLESELAFVRHHLGRPGQSSRSALQSHLTTLYKWLIEPFEGSLRPRLVVVPDRCLSDLPFHALLSRKGYLLDHHVVSYAPSVQSYYAACEAQRTPKSSAVIVGLECDNLPSVAREIDAVASRVRGAAVYRGSDVAGVITELPSAALIHIASHGLFRSDDPSSSMLFLGSDVLTVRDISQLDLQAELITLSACSTGRGAGRLEGFMRAFTVLGIPSLVASFWDVNDESTALLMNAFYASLVEQPDIAQALRDAMLCVRNHSDDPYHWAPFSVIGRTRLREPWKSFHNTCTNLPIS